MDKQIELQKQFVREEISSSVVTRRMTEDERRWFEDKPQRQLYPSEPKRKSDFTWPKQRK